MSSSFDVGKTRALYVVRYACDPQNVARARAIVEQDLKNMQTTLVTPEELRQAKALLLREMPLSEASVDSIAGGLIYRTTHDLPLDEPTQAAHRYLELTAEQVQAAFAKWVRPNDLGPGNRRAEPKVGIRLKEPSFELEWENGRSDDLRSRHSFFWRCCLDAAD